MRRLARLAVATLLCCASLAAHAHRFHAGLTELGFNQKTGSIEIIHSYMAHDIEALLTNLYQRQFDLSQPDDEAVLRKYVEKQFYVFGADGKRLPLRWVGVSTGVERLVIYQEIEHTPLEQAARLHHDVLSDFLPDQVNTVNIKRGAGITTLAFGRDKPEQRLP